MKIIPLFVLLGACLLLATACEEVSSRKTYSLSSSDPIAPTDPVVSTARTKGAQSTANPSLPAAPGVR